MVPQQDAALQQIIFAREYVLALLADVDAADWFRQPTGSPTHLAWQVGHLAMAQYGLALYRQRGRQSEDLALMSSSFRKLFSRGTTPEADVAKYPSPAEIQATFDRVYAQALLEIPTFTAEQLAEPSDMPYAGSPTKLGALLFCPLHEMIHAGQIGLLRRLMGKPPIR